MFEDVLMYSCDPGFTLIGSSERKCQADGAWSCEAPICAKSGTFNVVCLACLFLL